MDDYDVFLNHRGPDVKGGFIAHLHDALRSVGLNAFLDKKSLVQGDPAFESINEALSQKARVQVAIVSKGYGESKYCLCELVAIMGSGKPVIPVVYDVEPAHLRRVENGPFAAAFEKHESRETLEQVVQWADALRKLAEVTGFCFRLSDYNGDEVELKQQVVAARMRVAPTNVAPDIFSKLPNEYHLVYWGLLGWVELAKRLLLKEIFNHFVCHKRFQAMSFVKVNCNSPSSTEVGPSLLSIMQKQLQWDLLHVPDSTQQSYEYCFQKLLNQGPILVVLDGIHNKCEFDKLILDTGLLAQGSCIIITSCDRHLLKLVGSGTNFYLHKVTTLGCDDSEKLVNWHAFGSEKPQENFLFVAQNVSEACGGLPLALKVVGCSLFDKLYIEDQPLCVDAVDALRGNQDVMNALRWSYNCLLELEKLMFLDIACVFYGWEKQEALKN